MLCRVFAAIHYRINAVCLPLGSSPRMTPNEESRLLAIVLKRVEGGAKSPPHVRWLSAITWLLLVAAFVALFQFVPRVGPVVYVVAGVSCMLGILTSFVVIYKHSLKQWPVLSPFIKVEEVKRRIGELNPNKSLERTPEG